MHVFSSDGQRNSSCPQATAMKPKMTLSTLYVQKRKTGYWSHMLVLFGTHFPVALLSPVLSADNSQLYNDSYTCEVKLACMIVNVSPPCRCKKWRWMTSCHTPPPAEISDLSGKKNVIAQDTYLNENTIGEHQRRTAEKNQRRTRKSDETVKRLSS